MRDAASPPPRSLEALRILVTRPAAQADVLCRQLEARGASVARLPLQAIEPARQPALAARQLREGRDASAWIFTSVNAVHFAAQLDAGPWPPVMAVGAATAVALEKLGHTSQTPQQDYSSEALLELPLLRNAGGRRLIIVTGENSRELLAATLRERGAEVSTAAVYRRVLLPHGDDAVSRALQRCQLIVITSGEALARLLQLTPEARRARLLRTPLLLPSARVVEQARQLGFSAALLVPEPMADAAIVRRIEAWTQELQKSAPSSAAADDAPP